MEEIEYNAFDDYLTGKHLINVNKTLNTDNLCEYIFVMMLSEYITKRSEKMNRTNDNDDDKDDDDDEDDDNDNDDDDENNKANDDTNNDTNVNRNNNSNDDNNDDNDDANNNVNNFDEKNVNNDRHDEIRTLNKETFHTEMKRLFDEANDMKKHDKIHVVQIRSIPVADYYYLLRHYFVRIDELVDIHPGNEQRICLRGWYTNTDIGSDTLESEYRLCKRCLDECLPKLWDGARKFNFIFRNCDQCCNRSHQSIGIAVALFLTISTTVAFVTNGHYAPLILILLAQMIVFAILHFSHLYSSSLIQWLDYNPSVSNRNARSFVCRHVKK